MIGINRNERSQSPKYAQVAKALYLGAEWAKKYDFQYVVTMNSDDLPDMTSYDDFNIDDYLVDLKITDTENGGLFGVRF
ncbi:DUF2326 domain-containing protein [Vibrio navarrensis]|uniref:DUF2326 domain-containing protein n=1 Tax=Vibrio navarrensis TaxID=29495 RepID=UPI0029C0C6CA|nr:DUF2326 domain-containing protein [Vibrio navarrensis]MBE4619570.1 hypothetical protein [Vibrio navarrensis]